MGLAISEIYIGAAIEDIPTAIPPTNLKKEKVKGSVANADPTAETKKNKPIKVKVFFRPNLFVGKAPNKAPMTVPQSAIDIMKKPWKTGPVDQSSLIGRLAPEITTVSNPNRKPDKAATSIHLNVLFIENVILRVRTLLKVTNIYINSIKKTINAMKNTYKNLLIISNL